MRLLIDTNIFLEVLLNQEKAKQARELLSKTDVFRQFLTDMIFNAGVQIISLAAKEMETVINAAQKFALGFDDAYQYVVAEQYSLTLISFDTDFDRTERGRKTPEEVRT